MRRTSDRGRAPLLLALLVVACNDTPDVPASVTLDHRVAHLRNWVPLRRSSDGSLFFLDRFEAREQDLAEMRPPPRPDFLERDLPLASVTLQRAIQIAREYWGRIPSLEEWRTAVAGTAGYRFPWGEDDGNRLRANTPKLGLGRRTRVGTFESGRDLGRGNSCYDLFGNVAEWTLTPYSLVRVDKYEGDRDPTRYDVLEYRLQAMFDVLSPELPSALTPWWPGSFYIPELNPFAFRAAPTAGVTFCVVGFSHAQRQPLRHTRSPYWEQLGIRDLQSDETESDVGMRMATDPYTMIALLERASGQPLAPDREALAAFLLEHAEAFRRAARLRMSLDRKALGLPPTGPWARAALSILGVP